MLVLFQILTAVPAGTTGDAGFTYVSDVTVDPTGQRLYVLDLTSGTVHLFSGSSHTTFARKGLGPGEIASGRTLHWIGDTLLVIDTPNRVHFFAPTGKLYRTRTATQTGPLAAGSSWIVAAIRPEGPLPMADGVIVPWRLARYDYGGKLLTPLGEMHGIVQPLVVTMVKDGARLQAHTHQPFRDDPIIAVDREGRVVYTLHRRTSREGPHRFRLVGVAIATGDTVLDRAYPYEPKPLTQAVINGSFHTILATFKRGMTYLTLALDQKEVMDGLYRPFHVPAVEAMLVARDGTIWLRREAAGTMATYQLLAPNGQSVGTVRLPAGEKLAEATKTRAWTVATDEDGVEAIRWYNFRR